MINALSHLAVAALAVPAVLLGSGAATVARADNYAYMGSGTSDFGVIDLTTGVFTHCGTTGVVLSGLGVGPDHLLYGGAFDGSSFYSVSKTKGTLTQVGTSGIQFFDFGSTLSGLYAVDTSGSLYSIDYQTGQAHLIGPTGVTVSGSAYWGMSTNSKRLYFSHQSTLYVLNLKTGAATLIGTASSGIFGAEVYESGVLFAGSETPLSVYELNILDGSSTFIANVSGTGSGNFWGLAPIKASSINAAKICASHPT